MRARNLGDEAERRHLVPKDPAAFVEDLWRTIPLVGDGALAAPPEAE